MDGRNLNLPQRIAKLALARISAAPVETIFISLLLTIALGLTLFVFNVFTAAGINFGPTPA